MAMNAFHGKDSPKSHYLFRIHSMVAPPPQRGLEGLFCFHRRAGSNALYGLCLASHPPDLLIIYRFTI